MSVILAESMPSEIPVLYGAIATMAGAIVFLYHRELRCQRELRRMTKELTNAQADINTINVEVEQMQWSGDLTIHGEVTVNAHTGLIDSWNPAATAILYWPSREMLGRPLVKIIPERFREKHLEAMRRVVQSGAPPKSGPFYQTAVRKDGTEVDIEATYSGWHDSKTGDLLVGAVIRRYVRPKPDSDAKTVPSQDGSTVK